MLCWGWINHHCSLFECEKGSPLTETKCDIANVFASVYSLIGCFVYRSFTRHTVVDVCKRIFMAPFSPTVSSDGPTDIAVSFETCDMSAVYFQTSAAAGAFANNAAWRAHGYGLAWCTDLQILCICLVWQLPFPPVRVTDISDALVGMLNEWMLWSSMSLFQRSGSPISVTLSSGC